MRRRRILLPPLRDAAPTARRDASPRELTRRSARAASPHLRGGQPSVHPSPVYRLTSVHRLFEPLPTIEQRLVSLFAE